MAAGLMVAAAAGGPSWLWYATRGLGATTLIVLTATVVLGILTATRWSGDGTPGFVAVDLHRNLSLLAMCLLVAHLVTTVLDPFAHISVRDVLIPVGASYRPIWLGLGVGAFWVLVGVAATSLLRDRIGVHAWRLIHWAAYASWPLALVHALGTGSDSRSPWLVSLAASCTSAIVLAIFERLRDGRLITLPVRGLAAIATIAFLVGAGVWAANGPFQPGWSAKAGTPVIKTASVASGVVHPGPGGFSDPLVGVLQRDAGGNISVALRDAVDPELTIAIRPPDVNETLPVMTIARNGRTLCTVPANPDMYLYAVCGSTRLTVTFYGSESVLKSGGPITGRLDTSGPLN